MTERARINWKGRPKCFDSDEQWRDWMEVKTGACGPCEDCTPEHRKKMRDLLRCERPEVIFLRDREGEVFGVSADDRRYARLLMGLSVGAGEIVGRSIESTDGWVRLLEHVRKRAQRDVKRAIDVWMRRARKA